MKHCNKSYKCPYGSAFEKNLCAYDENLNEYDLCPYLLENWDYIIDELIKEKDYIIDELLKEKESDNNAK